MRAWDRPRPASRSTMADDMIPIETLLEHESWLRSLAARLASEDQADDLVQETWLRAVSRPAKGLRSPRAWLATVLRNVALQRTRAEGRRSDHTARLEPAREAPGADNDLERLELWHTLVEEVLLLPEPYRDAVMMRYYRGLSTREIAKRISAPLATVESRIARGLAKLRERLDRRGGGRESWLPVVLTTLRDDAALPSSLAVSKLALVCAAVLLSVGVVWFAVVRAPRAASFDLPAVAALPESAAAVPETERGLRRPAASARTDDVARPTVAPTPFRGRLVDLRGRALSGVGLTVRSAVLPAPLELETGAAGWFEGEVAAARALVHAKDSRWTTLTTSWVDAAAPERESLIVVAPSIRVRGVVVDEEDRPVEGATVSVELAETWTRDLGLVIDDGEMRVWRKTTGADGVFSFDAAPTDVDGWLAAKHRALRGRIELPPGDEFDLRIVVRRKGRDAPRDGLRGRVVDELDRPVHGAVVALGEHRVRTNTAGRFALPVAGLAAGRPLVVAHPGSEPLELPDPAGPDAAEHGWESPVRVQLTPAVPLAIEGRLQGPAGAPIAGGYVWLRDPTRLPGTGADACSVEGVLAGGNTWTRTSEDGRFRLAGLRPRDYDLAAWSDGVGSRGTLDGVRAGTPGVVVRIDAPAPAVEVVGSCHTPAGAPAVGATVELRSLLDLDAEVTRCVAKVSATVAEDGTFRIERWRGPLDQVEVSGGGLVTATFDGPFDARSWMGLTAPRRAHLQVSGVGQFADADTFRITDEDGAFLPLLAFERYAAGEFQSCVALERARIDAGQSGLFAASELARHVVIYADGRELVRMPIRLDPGEVTRVFVH